jgi:hypothetical protein
MGRIGARRRSRAVSTGCRAKSNVSNAILGLPAETLALFVRFWLTITPPLPNDAQAAAQIKGRERFGGTCF